ncbi:hypothetical protein J437_LFUL014384, partial [Ladona fulva]
MSKYEWIQADKQYFGQPNTEYDFTSIDTEETRKRIASLTDTKERLSRNVNTRSMNLLGKVEEQYSHLLKKKKTVLHDKEQIMRVIKDLDDKKKKAVAKAWQQVSKLIISTFLERPQLKSFKLVNKDFSSIFSTLLPGAQAKLQPPEGMSAVEGLELSPFSEQVKVGFGGLWKDSLTELSGGQRSLVALSLILSMLQFKPAPLYILDEVDAALDLSHTENIGRMLRTHFRNSQFIIVSLKDGMFNNANVLFKTKFVDGVSAVTRELKSKVGECKKQEQEGKKKVAELEAKIADAKGTRERELKAAKQAMEKAKLSAEKSERDWTGKEQELETLRLETTELKSSVESGKTQIEELDERVKKMIEDIKNVEEAVQKSTEEVIRLKGEVQKKKDAISATNHEIEMAIGRKEQLVKEKGEHNLEIEKLKLNMTKLKDQAKDNQVK